VTLRCSDNIVFTVYFSLNDDGILRMILMVVTSVMIEWEGYS